MIKDVTSIWDEAHTRRLSQDQSPSRYAEEVEKEFPRASLVADLGGGTGANAIHFLKHGHRVIEVDISQVALDGALKKAKKEGLDLTTLKVQIGTDPLPIKDNTLDVVYSRLALHYFDQTITAKIFKEIYTKLKPGGKAYITLKSPDDAGEMEYLMQTAIEIQPAVFNDKGTIKSRFSIAKLTEILKSAKISNFTVKIYREDLSGRVDWTKSGNKTLLLNEIRFTKV